MNGKSTFRAYLSAYHNEVTGSKLILHVEFPDGRHNMIQIEDGYFQELAYKRLNYVNDHDPSKIDAILITHNHIDHTGLLPKSVRDGFNGHIYMTEITAELCPLYLYNSCQHQQENVEEMKKEYPAEEKIFRPLYRKSDVENTIKKIIGVSYGKTIEILPGIEVTFFVNAHILGAAMILVQCKYGEFQPINFFFTGDYRLENCFFEMPPIPKKVREMPLIMVHEATNGEVDSKDVKHCLWQNITNAVAKKMDILIGVLAQGREQEMLYLLKLMQEAGVLPKWYNIYVDGPLGIKTTAKYQKILSWYNPKKADFLPEGVIYVTPEMRDSVLSDPRPKIILTTSGMLSQGPARTYVPVYLERPNAMIHLVSYAAEGTVARALLDAKHKEEVTYGSQKFKKRAILKSTREKSSHATADQMIGFINQFTNIQALLLQHGSYESLDTFERRVVEETDVEKIGRLNRSTMYAIYQYADRKDKWDNLVIKERPNKVEAVYAYKPSKEEEEKRRKAKRRRKAAKRAAKNRRGYKHH